MNILLTGGSGLVGRAAAEQLVARGHHVRLLSQHANNEVKRWPFGVEPWNASVADTSALQGAAEGCQAVIHAAGIVRETSRARFHAINIQGTENVIQEAIRANVRRFLHISSLGAERGQSRYHRSKRAAENLVRQRQPPRWLIVRPGNVYGPGDQVLSVLTRIVRISPAIPLVGNGRQEFQPIWSEDLGRALAELIERDEPVHLAVEAVGRERTTMRQSIELIRQLTERRTLMIPIPVFLWRATLWLAERLGFNPPITDDQILMLLEDNTDRPAHRQNILDELALSSISLKEGMTKLVDSFVASTPQGKTGILVRQHHYLAVTGIDSAPDAFNRLREHFGQLMDQLLVEFDPEQAHSPRLDNGMTINLNLPMRGHVQVRVVDQTPTSATAVTLEGHPLAGIITWSIQEQNGSATKMEVTSITRTANLIDKIGMGLGGNLAQETVWTTFIQRAAKLLNATPIGETRHEHHVLEGECARNAEEQIEEYVNHRARMDVLERTVGAGAEVQRS